MASKKKAHKWPTCRSTGKKRFGERKDAKQALRAASRVRARARLDEAVTRANVVRAYRCSGLDGCRGWHLTSQSFAAGNR